MIPIKNPNKNRELKILVQTLKDKNVITEADLENSKKKLTEKLEAKKNVK